jgi:HNH endonuclease/NUMOD4 motif
MTRRCEMCAAELDPANSDSMCRECALILADEKPSDERWRTVAGWPRYEVSDWGRVRRIVPQSLAGAYPAVTLSEPGRRSLRVRVHQLVARAFLGPCPDGQEVLHGNDEPYDNRASNLRYGTRAENLADRRRVIAQRLNDLDCTAKTSRTVRDSRKGKQP